MLILLTMNVYEKLLIWTGIQVNSEFKQVLIYETRVTCTKMLQKSELVLLGAVYFYSI